MVVDTNFLPVLSQSDVERTVQLIQQAYAPPTASTSLEDLKRLQTELFELQKRPEAWGLVIPLLEHPDQNVQFFGAHTAQVKIARDWDTLSEEHATPLRELIVQLTAHSMSIGRSKFILRKMFVALTTLALKLVPGHPTRWPEWIMGCTMTFSDAGAPTEYIHDFLAIVAEEAGNADLIGSSKLQIQQSLKDAISMVVQAIRSSLQSTQQIPSALKCFQSWMSIIPSSDITPLIPLLISLLTCAESDSESFEVASDTLQEIMTKSALSDGSGSRTLTEPLLIWIDSQGSRTVHNTLQSGNVDGISHSLCKLLVALGDHSTSYIAANLASPTPVVPAPQPPGAPLLPTKTRGELSQSFLRLLLSYTGLRGHYGVDEEESEMTLAFWYLFQEALWSTDYYVEEEEEVNGSVTGDASEDVQAVAKAVYSELVQVLRRKVAFPEKGAGWSKDQVEKFQVYRRDVGDTLINAYYVLRHDMLGYLVEDVIQRLNGRQEQDGWQEIEATLHCITSIQEAIDMEKTPHLPRVFGPEILGRLPSTGTSRIRRTTLGLIGAYSSWFTSQPSISSGLLMSVLTYVASALTDPILCLQAAIALRNLCDANRKALAPEIRAFGQLHAALGSIPESEKSKVVQSIASVIQALPAHEQIEPITAIVDPIVRKLAEVLQSHNQNNFSDSSLTFVQLPDEARMIIINEVETLSGVAKGLTRSTDGLVILGERDSESQASLEAMERVREDPRVLSLRKTISDTLEAVVNIWSTDAGISNVPTLISLAPGPLLGLVCHAARRQLTASWLSLSVSLISQLNPPPPLVLVDEALNVKTGPAPEAVALVGVALPMLLECSLNAMSPPGAMEANPDIVQEFFVCMDRVAQDFTRSFYILPPGALDALMNCTITALSLQERYSLVQASNFICNLIQRSSVDTALAVDKEHLIHLYGRRIMKAVLEGFASVAPRSVVPNLIEILGTLLSRAGGGLGGGGGAGGAVAASWIREILLADDFVVSRATREVKETFATAIINSRSLKRTREAANQFTLVARGLESSGFGYASVSM
ncbi:Importin-13 [Termitomyces sp. J132]|nr:Importin-13 [Termitomyces sp. J132]